MESGRRAPERVFHVFAERANAGDLLSAEGIKDALGRDLSFVDCQLSNAAVMAESMQKLAQATADDLIVIGGGGLFHHYFTPVWETVADQELRAAVHVWGVGLVASKTQSLTGPPATIRRALRRAHSASVRDERSRDFVRLDLPVIDCPSSVALHRWLGGAPATPRGYLLHVMHEDLVGPAVHEHAGRLRRLAALLGLEYAETDNMIPAGRREDLDGLLAMYARSDVVVSSRLHGCIIAAAMGKPVIALSNDEKIDSFMARRGLDDWCLSVDDAEGLRHAVLTYGQQSYPSWVKQAAEANRLHGADLLEAWEAAALRAGESEQARAALARALADLRGAQEAVVRDREHMNAIMQSRAYRAAQRGRGAWARLRDLPGAERLGNRVLARWENRPSTRRLPVDRDFYRRQLERLAVSPGRGIDEVAHYQSIGWRLGLDPSPEFSGRGYLALHADARRAGWEPLAHYVHIGRAQAREVVAPDPAVDYVGWILEACGHVDEKFYLQQVGDRNLQGLTPALHYLAFGWREGLRPNEDFDTSYSVTTEDGVFGLIHPFVHHTRFARAAAPEQPQYGEQERVFREVLGQPTIRYATGDEDVVTTAADSVADDVVALLSPDALGLVVSVCFDDYDVVTGGVQLCLGVERAQLRARGYDYISVHPHRPAQSLAPPGSDPALVVKVNESVVPGLLRTSALASMIETVRERTGHDPAGVVVHGLLGHEPGLLKKNLQSAVKVFIDFWAHDYYSACISPALTRNRSDHCGGPPVTSASCRCCMFGELRTDHMARMAEFVGDPGVRVTVPSALAGDVLRRVAPQALRDKRVEVIPHGRLVPRKSPAFPRPASDGILRLAFVGLPSRHKGWTQYVNLQEILATDSSVQLWHLGAEKAQVERFEFLSQTGRNPDACEQQLRRLGIDAVVAWSTTPETFGFTAHEALAAGCVLVTSPAAGNVFCVATEMGRAVTYRDDAALYEAARSGDLVRDLRMVMDREVTPVEFRFSGLMASRLA